MSDPKMVKLVESMQKYLDKVKEYVEKEEYLMATTMTTWLLGDGFALQHHISDSYYFVKREFVKRESKE